ncbi:hypothetical protein ACWGJ9_07295 [Curtobacterium citreum]
MTVDTAELRTRARNVDAMALPGTSDALSAAADEIDALRATLASAPHLAVCTYMTEHFAEPCSCWKTETALEPPLALDAVTRLTVAGPHGPVLGLPRVAGVHLDVDGSHHLTVSYSNP